MKIAEYIEQNTATLPPKLAEMTLQDASIWSNNACYGYCITAMEAAGYPRKKIAEMLNYLCSAFGTYTVEEAEAKYINW